MTTFECHRCDNQFHRTRTHVIYRATYFDPEESEEVCPYCGSLDYEEIELTEEEES